MNQRAADTATASAAARWLRKRERGSVTLLRIMIFLALRLGRPLALRLLYLIAAYFFAFAPAERRASREYLRRALGREPRARDRFRHVYTFATTILDRLYLVRERYEVLEVTIEGEPLMRELLVRGHGAFLLGAHLGSFEIMGAVGRRQPGLRLAMAMYEHNASNVATFFSAGHAVNAPEIIPLGHLEAMLRIRDCLSEGRFVGMLADRTFAEAPVQSVSFLGRAAHFPLGPMRAAAALRQPVVFMTGLYRGGNRYHIVFRLLADFSQPCAAGRAAAVHQAVERYVALLEEFCRSDPFNWFNFYDFWHGADEVTRPPVGATRKRAARGAGA
jgi:predicted LPLAT superfamily acyltransferase